MNHDELLSRYLDGECSLEERRRVESDAEIQAELAAQRKLHGLAVGLPMTRADFTAEDVLVRAGQASRTPSRWTWAAAAAAVFLMAVTHAAAFLYGVQRAEEPVASSPIDDTEEILREMAALDASTPHDRLNERLVDLRGDLKERDVLARLSSATIPAEQRPRADQLAGDIGRLMVAFEQVEDPGFRALAVRKLASQALGARVSITLIPTTARNYQRVTRLGAGRFSIIVVRGGEVLADEGTVEELETRNVGLKIRIKGEDR